MKGIKIIKSFRTDDGLYEVLLIQSRKLISKQ